MTNPPSYPLEQVMLIKKNRFDQAIKTLEAKKEILEKAYEKLFDLTQEKEQEEAHRLSKLNQIREALDQGTNTDKIQQMKVYLKVVDQRVLEKRKKVEAQQKIVNAAQVQVDLATEDLFQKKKDLEKLELHKKEWEKEMRYAIERKEEEEHDEQGAATHQMVKRDKNLRKKKREKENP